MAPDTTNHDALAAEHAKQAQASHRQAAQSLAAGEDAQHAHLTAIAHHHEGIAAHHGNLAALSDNDGDETAAPADPVGKTIAKARASRDQNPTEIPAQTLGKRPRRR